MSARICFWFAGDCRADEAATTRVGARIISDRVRVLAFFNRPSRRMMPATTLSKRARQLIRDVATLLSMKISATFQNGMFRPNHPIFPEKKVVMLEKPCPETIDQRVRISKHCPQSSRPTSSS